MANKKERRVGTRFKKRRAGSGVERRASDFSGRRQRIALRGHYPAAFPQAMSLLSSCKVAMLAIDLVPMICESRKSHPANTKTAIDTTLSFACVTDRTDGRLNGLPSRRPTQSERLGLICRVHARDYFDSRCRLDLARSFFRRGLLEKNEIGSIMLLGTRQLIRNLYWAVQR